MPEKYIPDERIHDGHRQRMRRKFKEHGSDVFDTYELLEMLLYYAIPLCDTNPVAKRLLHAHKSLEGVFSASCDELMLVDGVGRHTAEFLNTVGKLPYVLECDTTAQVSLFSDYCGAANFFVERLKNERSHAILMLHLDNNMLPITLQKLYAADFGSAAVKVEKFTASALRMNSSVVMIAHNHPLGPLFPGEGDIVMHNNVENALEDVDVLLAEHYLVSGEQYIGLVRRKFDRLRDVPELEGFVNGREAAFEATKRGDKSSSGGSFSMFEPSNSAVSRTAMLLSPISGEKAEAYAYSLLSLFGNLSRAMAADYSRLSVNTDERTALYIKLLARIHARRETEKMTFGHMYSIREIKRYLKALFLGEACEKLYVLSISSDRRITACDCISTGTVNGTTVTPRMVLSVAMRNKAHSIILAHNHPCGKTTPSADDMALTLQLSSIVEKSSVKLRAHYVVAGNECEAITENLQL